MSSKRKASTANRDGSRNNKKQKKQQTVTLYVLEKGELKPLDVGQDNVVWINKTRFVVNDDLTYIQTTTTVDDRKEKEQAFQRTMAKRREDVRAVKKEIRQLVERALGRPKQGGGGGGEDGLDFEQQLQVRLEVIANHENEMRKQDQTIQIVKQSRTKEWELPLKQPVLVETNQCQLVCVVRGKFGGKSDADVNLQVSMVRETIDAPPIVIDTPDASLSQRTPPKGHEIEPRFATAAVGTDYVFILYNDRPTMVTLYTHDMQYVREIECADEFLRSRPINKNNWPWFDVVGGDRCVRSWRNAQDVEDDRAYVSAWTVDAEGSVTNPVHKLMQPGTGDCNVWVKSDDTGLIGINYERGPCVSVDATTLECETLPADIGQVSKGDLAGLYRVSEKEWIMVNDDIDFWVCTPGNVEATNWAERAERYLGKNRATWGQPIRTSKGFWVENASQVLVHTTSEKVTHVVRLPTDQQPERVTWDDAAGALLVATCVDLHVYKVLI